MQKEKHMDVEAVLRGGEEIGQTSEARFLGPCSNEVYRSRNCIPKSFLEWRPLIWVNLQSKSSPYKMRC